MRIRVTVADFCEAIEYEWGKGKRQRMEASAHHVACLRLLQENSRKTDEAMARSEGLTGAAWLANSDEITRLFAEHDALSDEAFPGSTSTPPTPEDGGAR